jgi:hypothetical protein
MFIVTVGYTDQGNKNEHKYEHWRKGDTTWQRRLAEGL